MGPEPVRKPRSGTTGWVYRHTHNLCTPLNINSRRGNILGLQHVIPFVKSKGNKPKLWRQGLQLGWHRHGNKTRWHRPVILAVGR